MTERSVAHGSFTVKRHYPQPPATVFRFWSDPALKRTWFGSPVEEDGAHYAMDFRVGGRERAQGAVQHGTPSYRYDALYQDIVPDQRIVSTYDMHMGDERISVSLAVLELHPAGDGGTDLVLTEHGAFLDGLDTVAERERGTKGLMDALGSAMADVD